MKLLKLSRAYQRLIIAGGVTALLASLPSIVIGQSEPSSTVQQRSVSQVNTVLDGDTNAPQAPRRPNNSIAEAQPIPNPSAVSGYASKAGGDDLDIYRVNLLAGQALTLFLPQDGMDSDLDLALFHASGSLLDASVGSGRIKSLTAEQDGEYLVVVQANNGASRYMLTVGQAPVDVDYDVRLSYNFALGEAVVKFREQSAGKLGARAQIMGLTARSQGEAQERNRLIKLIEQRQLQSSANCTIPSALPGATANADEEMQAKLGTLCMVKSLSNDQDVENAAPNYIRKPMFIPNDQHYGLQWHYPQISLPQAWDVSTGDGVIVAVVDSGIVFNHPDLQGQLLPGYDFIQSPLDAQDGDGIDPDPTDVGHDNPDGSTSFHGTHVSGTVAAATNNSIGVAGIAFTAKVMPLRVCGMYSCTTYDIEQAIRYAARLTNDSDTLPPQRADVINMSLGWAGSSAAEQALFNQVRDQGVIVVAAAGNESTSRKSYPAAYEGVLSVSATTLEKKLAWYSNYGDWIDLAAPGGDASKDINNDGFPDGIFSTLANDRSTPLIFTYKFYNGTSMASPHAAGVMALMKAAAPNLTPQEVGNLLQAGKLTDDPGTAGRDNSFGYGQINAYKAVLAVKTTPPPPPPPPPADNQQPLVQNGDYNGDGHADLIWQNSSTGKVDITLQDGFTIIEGRTFYTEPDTTWKIVGNGDFDGNKKSDLLWRNMSNGLVYLMPMNGANIAGGQMIYHEPNQAWQIVAVGDLNGDGKSDIIWWNSDSGHVYGMVMNGYSITAGNFLYQEPNTAWRILAARDFTGDGKADLLWRNQTSGQVYLMPMDGLSIAGGSMFYHEPNLAWSIVAANDLNGDGKADLVWWNNQTGDVWAMLMDGATISQQGMIYQEPNTAWRIVASGDYDGDGKSDLYWRNIETNYFYHMVMNGLQFMGGQLTWEAISSWRIAANATTISLPTAPPRSLSGVETGIQLHPNDTYPSAPLNGTLVNESRDRRGTNPNLGVTTH